MILLYGYVTFTIILIIVNEEVTMKKVGNFFAKIGQGIKKGFLGLVNWIKNTAWIQPLLIVGLIFGVIMSIKPFVSWIGGVLNPDENYRFLISKKDKNRDIVSKFEIIDGGTDSQGKQTRTVKNQSPSAFEIASTHCSVFKIFSGISSPFFLKR